MLLPAHLQELRVDKVTATQWLSCGLYTCGLGVRGFGFDLKKFTNVHDLPITSLPALSGLLCIPLFRVIRLKVLEILLHLSHLGFDQFAELRQWVALWELLLGPLEPPEVLQQRPVIVDEGPVI